MNKTKAIFKDLQRALLSGVSFMMPIVVAGGLMMAISLATGSQASDGTFKVTNGFMQNIKVLGDAAFVMMIPVLSGYIAYSLAGKPGLAPGLILGYIANNPIGDTGAKSGFLGAMLLGIAAGYLVKWMKTWKVPKIIKSIMPILIIPIVTVFIIGLLYIYVLATPLGILMHTLIDVLRSMNGTSTILLAICIGLMNAFDMGGPITKSVSMFTLALMNEGIYGPNGMFRVTVAIPPIAIFLSTILFKRKFQKGDRAAAVSAGIMGCMGITEGAIPFAVSDFKHIMPGTMIGAACGAVIAAVGKVECFVPHGGFVVLPVVEHRVWFIAAILIGSIIGACLIGLLKPKLEEDKE